MTKRTFVGLVVARTLVAIFGMTAWGQDRKLHRVVFEVITEGAEQWQAILNNVENLQRAFGKGATEIELVAHGKGLSLLKKTNAELKDRIISLSSPTTRFVACENSMRRMQVKKEDLILQAGTVDSGGGGST